MVVLDVLMPGLDGWEVCRRIRLEHHVPVLMLTALTDVEDKLEAFDAGADDYVTKPFDPRELVARVEALARRYKVMDAPPQSRDREGRVLKYGGLAIDTKSRQVSVDGKPVSHNSQGV